MIPNLYFAKLNSSNFDTNFSATIALHQRLKLSPFFLGGVLREGLPPGGAVHQDGGRRADRDGQARDQVGGRLELHLEAVRAKVLAPVRGEAREHHVVTLA